MKREQKVVLSIKILLGFFTLLALFDLFGILFNNVYFMMTPRLDYHAPFVFGQYFSLLPAPIPSSYMEVNRYFMIYYFFAAISFPIYFYWRFELNDDDEWDISEENRINPILFEKKLGYIVLANCIVPMIVAILIGNLYLNSGFTVIQVLNVVAIIQLVLYSLFLLVFVGNWRQYKISIKKSGS